MATCDDFAASLDAQIALTDERKRDSLFRALLGIIGLDFVYDLIAGDDKLGVLVDEIVAAVLAGAFMLVLRLLKKLALKLGIQKRVVKILGRFFLLALVAMIAAGLYDAYNEREKIHGELEEFALQLATDSAYAECPKEQRNAILRARGLPQIP